MGRQRRLRRAIDLTGDTAESLFDTNVLYCINVDRDDEDDDRDPPLDDRGERDEHTTRHDDRRHPDAS